MAINGGNSALTDAHPIKPYHDELRKENYHYDGSRHDSGQRINTYKDGDTGHEIEISHTRGKGITGHQVDPAYTSGGKQLRGKSPSDLRKNLNQATHISHEAISEEE